jgi:hypothetical protein
MDKTSLPFSGSRWHWLPLILLGAAMHVAAAPAPSQGWRELAIAPATLKLGNLDRSWDRFYSLKREIPAQAGDEEEFRVRRLQLMAGGVGLYFSHGRTIVLGGHTYLLAYRLDRAYLRWDFEHNNDPLDGLDMPSETAGRFSKNALLTRCLLNLAELDDLEEYRPFNSATDVLSADQEAQLTAINQDNLGDVLFTWVLNGTEKGGLPLASIAQFRRDQGASNSHRYWFGNPSTGEPYRTNARLGGVATDYIMNADKLAAVYEGVPAADGTFATLFLNGISRRLTQAQLTAALAVKPVFTSEKEQEELSAGFLKRLRKLLLTVAKRNMGGKPHKEWFIHSGGESLLDARPNALTLKTFSWRTKPIPVAAQQHYNLNPALKDQVLEQVPHPESVIFIAEAEPDSKHTRAVIYLDGHVARLPTKEVATVMHDELETE